MTAIREGVRKPPPEELPKPTGDMHGFVQRGDPSWTAWLEWARGEGRIGLVAVMRSTGRLMCETEWPPTHGGDAVTRPAQATGAKLKPVKTQKLSASTPGPDLSWKQRIDPGDE